MNEINCLPSSKVNLSIPGHIKQAFKSIERYLPVIDLILEIVDARLPFSSRVHGFVEKLNKKFILVLNKSDLADKNETKRWIEWYKKSNVFCTDLNAHANYSIQSLIKNIKSYYYTNSNSTKRVIRLILIGIPNVGKSTIINALARRYAAKVANKPGVTKNIQWVKVDKGIELLDLPGILDFKLLKNAETLRLLNCIPGPQEDPEIMFYDLVKLLKANNLISILPNAVLLEKSTIQSYLIWYGESMKFLLQGGVVDTRRAALDIIKRFQNGFFGRITIEKVENFEIGSLPNTNQEGL